MSRSIFQISIAATVGVAIVSAGIFATISSHAQGGTGTTTSPGTTTTPSPAPTPGGSMGTPGTTTTPGDSMGTPGTTTTPGGSMGNPGTMTTPGGMSTPRTMTPAGKTIVSIAAGNKNFSTLVTALKAADLVPTLSAQGPFTVFAPTNAAFTKLPKATLANLLKPQNKAQLTRILTYHVVPGAVTSNMLKSGSVATVQGGNVNVKISGKKVMVNNANVIMADVKGSNGVIHAIDTVLMPPN
ncbi:fasciclin domain-containing protein [Chamaesiphon sp.]|uniref:fasciclin domain-containing protein n=1 Tax=Chamaesiphon sp. TaxID=2814140 RepID=UPI003593B75A